MIYAKLLNSTYKYIYTKEVCNFLVFFLVIIIKIKGKGKNPFHFTAAAGDDDDDKENDIYPIYNACKFVCLVFCIFIGTRYRKKM